MDVYRNHADLGRVDVHATERLGAGSICLTRLGDGEAGRDGGSRSTAGVCNSAILCIQRKGYFNSYEVEMCCAALPWPVWRAASVGRVSS